MARQRHLSQLLEKEITSKFEYFTELWAGYDQEGNTESPHRQRTTVNRLLGYAQFLAMPLDKADPHARPLRTLKEWQKHIGPIRDTDVLREWTRKCAKAAGDDARPAAEALETILLDRRNRLLQQVRADARGILGAETRVALHLARRDFQRALARLRAQGAHFNERAALHSVAAPWLQYIDLLRTDQSDHLLHSFRVKNKRLRFVLELIAEEETARQSERAPLLRDRANTAADLHSTLGNLHDLSVLKDQLRLQRAHWSRTAPNLSHSADALEAGRCKLEAKQFSQWFLLWPTIEAPGFLTPLLPKP